MKSVWKNIGSIALLFSVNSFADSADSPNAGKIEKRTIEIYEVKTKEGDQNPYIQVPITHDLFSFSRRTNLSDVIAIDSAKHQLPLRLVTITPVEEVSDEEMARCNLPFIPVAADLDPTALRELTNTEVKVSKTKNKTQTQVQKQTQILSQKTPEFYLIDLKALEQDSNQLEINWEPNAQSEYIEVEIEATRNLEDWEALGKKMLVQASVKNATNDNRPFIDNRIAINLAQNEYDYLKVKVVRGSEFFKLLKVQALSVKKYIHRLKAKQETWSIDGTEATKQTSIESNGKETLPISAWEYNRSEATPAESLTLDLGDITYADSIRVYSRASDKQSWQFVYEGPWIHVQVGSEWQTGNSIALYNNQNKLWRVEMNQSLRGLPAPKLNFTWQPYQLQIIASNRPPFLLAIDMGASNLIPNDQIFNQLIAKANPVWSPAELVSLNIDPEYTQPTNKDSSWRQWIFWLCLFAAVAVLFFFSWKLLKELKQNPLGTDD